MTVTLRTKFIDSSNDLSAGFRAQAELFSSILAEEGIRSRPYVYENLPFFSRLPLERQAEVMRIIGHSLDVFIEMKEAGDNLRDSTKLLWRCLRRLGWTPRSDVFDKISDSDVVEVYSTDFVGLFRNVIFYEYVSYTIEELFARPLWELTVRESKYQEKISEIAGRILSGEITGTIEYPVEPHIVEETCSQERARLKITPKLFSTLLSKEKLEGLLATAEFEAL